MREVIFRGKRKDNGKWVEGDLIQIPLKKFCSIMGQTAVATNYEVIPETVGQYTGLTDKNGKKIWEGDIVTAKIIEFSGEKYIGIWEVAYDTEYGYFYLKRPKNNLLFDGNWSYGVTKIEVIGNIHDNSELLKGDVEKMIFKCENCVNRNNCPENKKQYERTCNMIVDIAKAIDKLPDYHSYYSLTIRCDYWVEDKGTLQSFCKDGAEE